MANISKSGENYKVTIRRKGIEIYQTFEKEDDAKLFAKYKEYLIDQLETFDIPLKNMITIRQAIELKLRKSEEKSLDKKTTSDIHQCLKEFEDFLDLSCSDLTYKLCMEKAEKMLGSFVRKGGIGDGKTGKLTIQSPVTVLRKFSILSTAINELIKEGMEVENNPYKVCQYLRERIKNEK